MTLARDPVSIEDTFRRLLKRMGAQRIFDVTGKEEAHWTPIHTPTRTDRRLCVDDLMIFDLAADAHYGEGFPLYETLGRLLECGRAARFADQAAIARIAARFAKNSGEATSWLVRVISSDNPSLIEEALREVEEAAVDADAAVVLLRDALGRARARDGPLPDPG